MVKRKPSLGRRKIEIKRIQDEAARQVCFSKRRTSIFKKANELSILCGAEIATVVFSPGGKAFSFGHPSVDSIANCFLNKTALDGPIIGGGSQGGNRTKATINELDQECMELQNLVGGEKQKGKQVKHAMRRECEGRVMGWLNSGIMELELKELEEFQKDLMLVQGMVKGRMNQDATMDEHTHLPQTNMYVAPTALLRQESKAMVVAFPSSSYGQHEGIGQPSSTGIHGVDGFGRGPYGQFLG